MLGAVKVKKIKKIKKEGRNKRNLYFFPLSFFLPLQPQAYSSLRRSLQLQILTALQFCYLLGVNVGPEFLLLVSKLWDILVTHLHLILIPSLIFTQ